MKLALTGDKEFIQKIKHSKLSGFVHSKFNRTFNILSIENGELYTIACSEMDNGPNTLIIDIDGFENSEIEINDRVTTDNNKLFISNKMVINIESVKQWESELPNYPANFETLQKNIARMKQYIESNGRGGINKKLTFNSPFENEMSRMLRERTDLLIKEINNNCVINATEHAVSLIGLGQGLTPSGDDFLVGLFTILNMKRDSPIHLTFCEEVVKRAKGLTNDISYMALRKAAVGKVRESIILLLKNLINGREEELIPSLSKVLKIGSTSGYDIAFGLIAGLETNIKNGGK